MSWVPWLSLQTALEQVAADRVSLWIRPDDTRSWRLNGRVVRDPRDFEVLHRRGLIEIDPEHAQRVCITGNGWLLLDHAKTAWTE